MTAAKVRKKVIAVPVQTETKKKHLTFAQMKKNFVKDRWLYFFLVPVIIYFVVFKYVPIFLGLNMAFRDFNLSAGVLGSRWVGFKHFISLFQSNDFYMIMKNTILLNVYLLVFSFPVPIILALLLNEVKNKAFKKITQSIFYVPHFISWVVLGGIITTMLSPSTGVVNMILRTLGAEPIYFMASEKWWPVIYVLSEILQTAGWGTIIYMAAISSVAPDMYEAAIVDGAGKWKQTFYITLPSIAPTIIIMLILRMGKMLDMSFEQIYALQNDAVMNVSEVISTYEYRVGLNGGQYSYTTALGLFKGVVGLIFITITNKIANTIGETGLW